MQAQTIGLNRGDEKEKEKVRRDKRTIMTGVDESKKDDRDDSYAGNGMGRSADAGNGEEEDGEGEVGRGPTFDHTLFAGF